MLCVLLGQSGGCNCVIDGLEVIWHVGLIGQGGGCVGVVVVVHSGELG